MSTKRRLLKLLRSLGHPNYFGYRANQLEREFENATTPRETTCSANAATQRGPEAGQAQEEEAVTVPGPYDSNQIGLKPARAGVGQEIQEV